MCAALTALERRTDEGIYVVNQKKAHTATDQHNTLDTMALRLAAAVALCLAISVVSGQPVEPGERLIQWVKDLGGTVGQAITCAAALRMPGVVAALHRLHAGAHLWSAHVMAVC